MPVPSWLPCQKFQLKGFAAILDQPSEIKMNVLVGAFSQDLAVGTLFPTWDQKNETLKETGHLLSRSLRHGCVSGSGFEDFARCSGSSG